MEGREGEGQRGETTVPSPNQSSRIEHLSGLLAAVGAVKLHFLFRQTQSHVLNERQIPRAEERNGGEAGVPVVRGPREQPARPPSSSACRPRKEGDVCYQLDRSVPLGGLMADYGARMGFPYDAVRHPEVKWAEDLSMDDEDVIDTWTKSARRLED
ncbi:hypothetical protein ACJRO7_019067 [Eucalyptus globulus]|uniref:Uncharacterized protein n=1 Tax=Eucalyptus globulus TaxID=34317 RepID=A0ABD3KVY9_EUCGL